jgi:hypothetical protein
LPSLKRPHLDYLRDFYSDTALFGGGAQVVRCGFDFFGGEHVVFATDTPFGPIARAIKRIQDPEISEVDRRKIFGNAEKLFAQETHVRREPMVELPEDLVNVRFGSLADVAVGSLR